MRDKLDSRVPVYLQIIEHFKIQIASGKLQGGDVLPSRRELANEWRVNPNTVQRAYKEMEAEKLIYTDGNLPSKVTEDKAIINKVREQLLIDTVETFIESLHTLHIPLDEVLPLVKKRYAEFRNEKGDEK